MDDSPSQPSSPSPSPQPSHPPIWADTLFLLALRLVFFLLARGYLLKHLSPTLRGLSEAVLPTAVSGAGAGSVGSGSVSGGGRSQSLQSNNSSSQNQSQAQNQGQGQASLSAFTRPRSRSRSYSRSTVVSVFEDTDEDTPTGSTVSPALSRNLSSSSLLKDQGLGSGLGQGIELNLLGAKLSSAAAASASASASAAGPTSASGGLASGLASGSASQSTPAQLGPHSRTRESVTYSDDGHQTPQVVQIAHGRRSGGKRGVRGLHRASRLLFSICFAESMNLLTLVVFQAAGVLHARARQVNFSVSLHVLLGLILVVVPLVEALLLTYRSRDSASASARSTQSFRYRLVISLILFSLYLLLFSRIPPYITAIRPDEARKAELALAAAAAQANTPNASPDSNGNQTLADGTLSDALVEWSTTGPEGWEGTGWLASTLGRVVVLGVLIIAGLSGLGAVKTAWDYLDEARGLGAKPVSDADVLAAERSLYRVRHDMMAKRHEIMRVEGKAGAGGNGGGGGWMSRVFGSGNDEAESLEAELRGLQLMESDIARTLRVMKERRKRQGFRHTALGMLYNVLGYVFAIYCAARLVVCLFSLFISPLAPTQSSPSTSNGDWISYLLALGLRHVSSDVDVAAWARTISLLLTGLLILSSLSMVLRWLGRVLRLTSRSVGAGFLLLTLGQLFATYVISLLVQLRASLPPNALNADGSQGMPGSGIPAEDDSLLRSLPDFRVFGRLFDAVFLLSALGMAIYRYVAMKVASADDGELYSALGRERD